MIPAPSTPQALPFFLPVADGELFCLYYPAASATSTRGALLYVPPFADEMNACRRLAALQARAYAAHGYAVLQMDLWGCGDSSGEFAQARWERWLEDLATGWRWLGQHTMAPRYLWSVRLGALLASQFGQHASPAPAGALHWQAESDGAAYLKQLRRLQRLSQLLHASVTEDHSGSDAGSNIGSKNGSSVEIGGYQLAQELVYAIGMPRPTLPPAYPEYYINFYPPLSHAGAEHSPKLLPKCRLIENRRVARLSLVAMPFWHGGENLDLAQVLPASIAAFEWMARV